MSILIEGMEMPKKYPVTVTIFPDGISVVKTISGRRFTATAAPVPSHGRLIDADAVKFPPSEFWGFQATDNAKSAEAIVNSAPTIIPAEADET